MSNYQKKKERTRSNLRVFGGNSHPSLTKSIARKVGVQVGEVKATKFANNETNVDLKENVRGQDIYLLQTGGGPKPNDDLMELMFLINAFKLSSANQIVAVIPYFFYSKGDQKDSFKRVPITAKLVTNLLKKAGASHVMIMDPHTPQLEGFFDAPVDALKVHALFCEWIKKNIENWSECVIVAPDEGACKRCTAIANDLNLDFALINNRNKNVIKKKKISKSKSRYSSQSSTRKSSEVDSDTKDVTEEENANQSTLMTNNGNNGAASFRRSKSANKIAMGLARSLKKVSVSGSVHGRNVIIVDDMIDTGITLKNAVEVLKKSGAIGLHVLATHGLFSGDSIQTIRTHVNFIKKIVVTNTIPQKRNQEELKDILCVQDVSGLIAEYIRRHHYHEGVSVLSHFMPIRANDKEFEDLDDPHGDLEESTDDSENSDQEAELEQQQPELEKMAGNLNGSAHSHSAAAASVVEKVPDDDDEVVVEEEETSKEPSEDEKARDLRLMHLRKGFRLSSMCWDD